MEQGVTGDNGMLQAFPPNTGVGWLTMATGAYPADHGSTNNTYFRAGDAFTNRTSFSAPGVVQADTIADAAERAGKKVAQIDWVAGAASGIRRARSSTSRTSSPTAACSSARPIAVEQAGSAFFGVNYAGRDARSGSRLDRRAARAIRPRRRWKRRGPYRRLPPARESEPEPYLQRVLLRQRRRRRRRASTTSIVSPVGKTGAAPSVDLAVGDFEGIKLMGANGLIGTRAGQTAGHYVKLISTQPRRQPVQAVSHVADPGHRSLRRGLRRPAGRRRGRGQAREVHRRQPAAMGGGRLRPARGGRHRRGHVRRAGPRSRADLQPRGHQLHPRHPPAGHRPGDGRLPVHRRGLAPVPRARSRRPTRTATRTRATT